MRAGRRASCIALNSVPFHASVNVRQIPCGRSGPTVTARRAPSQGGGSARKSALLTFSVMLLLLILALPVYLAVCTITNMTGQAVSSLVQINGVSLYGYGVKTTDCSAWYSKQNGGARYPGNQTVCTNAGQIITIGTTSGYMKIEIDRDWLGKGYCGPNVPSCDNATLAQEQSSGSISLDVQGFVFWEGPYHWELHPFTAWKLSSAPPPPPPSNAPPTADFTWSPSTGPRRRPNTDTQPQGTRPSCSRRWTPAASRRPRITSSP